MRDPDLVKRAERAAVSLERAWIRWRAAHGLSAEPMPPVSSYVGYSLVEPWGQPRVVFGVGAEEAEKLAALLDGHDCVGPVHAEVSGLPDWRLAAGARQAAAPAAADPLGAHVPEPLPAATAVSRHGVPDQPARAAQAAPRDLAQPAAARPDSTAAALVAPAARADDDSGWLYGPQSALELSRPGLHAAPGRADDGDSDTLVGAAASRPPLSRMFPAVPLLPVAGPGVDGDTGPRTGELPAAAPPGIVAFRRRAESAAADQDRDGQYRSEQPGERESEPSQGPGYRGPRYQGFPPRYEQSPDLPPPAGAVEARADDGSDSRPVVPDGLSRPA